MRLDRPDVARRADSAGEGKEVLAAPGADIGDDIAGPRLVDIKPVVGGIAKVLLASPAQRCQLGSAAVNMAGSGK